MASGRFILLRNVSEDWHRSAKTAAAFEGGTLMPWVVAAMVRCSNRGVSVLHFARRSEAQWVKRLGRGGALHAFCRGL
jgi:hypothetical protein